MKVLMSSILMLLFTVLLCSQGSTQDLEKLNSLKTKYEEKIDLYKDSLMQINIKIKELQDSIVASSIEQSDLILVANQELDLYNEPFLRVIKTVSVKTQMKFIEIEGSHIKVEVNDVIGFIPRYKLSQENKEIINAILQKEKEAAEMLAMEEKAKRLEKEKEKEKIQDSIRQLRVETTEQFYKNIENYDFIEVPISKGIVLFPHPYANYKINDRIPSYSNIQLLNRVGGFIQVRYDDNVGFVNAKDLKINLQEFTKRNILITEDELIRKLNQKYFSRANDSKYGISIRGLGVTEINSADGVSIFIDWGYFNSSKKVKYISFSVTPYNNVGDAQTCRISGNSERVCKITGPLESPYHTVSLWENVWYNSTISCVKINKIKVDFMDGTTTTFINSLPKLFDKYFTNSCNF